MEPRKIDPWEAREKERAKREAWRQGKKRPSSSAPDAQSKRADSPFAWEGGFDFANNALPLGLLAAIVLLLLASIPFDGVANAQTYRSFLTKAGSILLLFCAIAGGAVGKNAIGDVRRGPHPLLLLLLAWTTLSLFLAPYKGYAVLEFVRIVDGVAAYFVAGYALKNAGKQAAVLTVGLLVFGCILSFAQIAEIGQRTGGFGAGITMSRFGAHGNIGSVLLLLWPPALAFAVWPGMEDKRRLAALAATLVIGCALLAERARSSWVGAAAAVLVLAGCYFLAKQAEDRPAAPSRSARRSGTANVLVRVSQSPLTLLGIGLVLFLAFSGGATRLIASRAASLGSGSAGSDATFQSRLTAWGGAARMTADKPLTGWGLGTYPVIQGRYTHMGDEVQAALSGNVDNLSLAHNYYLQWAADTGYVGLFLYGAFVAAYIATVLTKLPYLRSPFQQALASGVLAVVVGSHMDALASPSHHFHGVWVLLWAWMGLGLAALRPAPTSPFRPSVSDDAAQVAPLSTGDDGVAANRVNGAAGLVWGSGALFGAAFVLVVAAFAAQLQAEGRRIPRGVLEVVANGTGAGQAGTTLSWTAQYHNAQGESFPTSPGTLWNLQNGTNPGNARITQAAQQSLFVPPPINAMDLTGANRRSEFRALVPADAVRSALAADPKTAPEITVKATYFDAYGRKYEAWSARRLAVK